MYAWDEQTWEMDTTLSVTDHKCDISISSILTWFSVLANFSCSIAVLGNPRGGWGNPPPPPPPPQCPLVVVHASQEAGKLGGRQVTTDRICYSRFQITNLDYSWIVQHKLPLPVNCKSGSKKANLFNKSWLKNCNLSLKSRSILFLWSCTNHVCHFSEFYYNMVFFMRLQQVYCFL